MMETRGKVQRVKKPSYPFYAPPSCLVKTSAEIISEARAAMANKTMNSLHSQPGIRMVNTKRPFTPRDTNRILFGSRKNAARPPSAISLRQVQFHDLESGALPKIGEQGSVDQKSLPVSVLAKLRPQRWRLPAISDKRNQRKLQMSLENLPEEIPEVTKLKKETSGIKDPEEVSPELVTKVESETAEKPEKKQQPWSPKDYKTRGFPHSLMSPTNVVGMEKLIGSNDVAVEDNRINEARADAVVTQGTVIEDLEEDTVDSTVNKLNDLAESAVWTDSEVVCLLDTLYTALQKEGVPTSKNNKIKSHVLKVIFKFVETSGEQLLLSLARIILALRVNGQNLSAVCKLVFKVARCDKNDKYFLEKDVLELFVESLGRASPLEDAEACIYGYGALKFLTMNNLLLQEILNHGVLQLMVLHLKMVNNSRMESVPIPEQASHALFQLTGALRNIASEDEIFPLFVSSGTVTELCRSMQYFSADLDVISNISRTLSIISTNDECCNCVINHEGCFRTFAKLLRKFPGRQDIVVRLGYALGNIMAKSNTARIQLYQEPGALKAILVLLDNYLEKDLEMQTSECNGNVVNHHLGSDGSVEDVMIKMIRIIANMCIHPEVGFGLASGNSEEENMDNQNYTRNNSEASQFLDILLKVLRRKSLAESEELVISTLSTLNNLSFYSNLDCGYDGILDGPFAVRQIEVAEALTNLLSSDNEECLVEVTRVLGNLTRTKQIRDYLLETGGLCTLVRFLEKDNVDLLTTTTGVLVNMMCDWDKRIALKEDNGIERLIWILGEHSETNWKLANLICQTLWNFCIDSTHLYAALGVQSTNKLLSLLVDLLDEERLFGIEEGAEIDPNLATCKEYQVWEEFAGVATNLLEKIEHYLDSLEAVPENM